MQGTVRLRTLRQATPQKSEGHNTNPQKGDATLLRPESETSLGASLVICAFATSWIRCEEASCERTGSYGQCGRGGRQSYQQTLLPGSYRSTPSRILPTLRSRRANPRPAPPPAGKPPQPTLEQRARHTNSKRKAEGEGGGIGKRSHLQMHSQGT